MKICLLSVDRLFTSDSEFDAVLASIPFGEGDKEELRKIKNSSAARESLGARVALMRLCGKNDFGDIEKNENGKPYFKKSDSPFFSLSHTKGIAAAVLCDKNDGLVGIDVEIINHDRKLSNIAKRFFSPNELERYKKADSPEDFYSIWTEKEARIKLFGKNLSSELTSQEKEALYFYKYKVRIFDTYAMLCIASSKEQNEIIFINDEGLHLEKII